VSGMAEERRILSFRESRPQGVTEKGKSVQGEPEERSAIRSLAASPLRTAIGTNRKR